MPKVILRAAADLYGRDVVELSFTSRSYPAVEKWLECLRSVSGKTPWKWGYTASHKDLPKIERRIKDAVLKSDLKDTYLKQYIVNDDLPISQDVVNAIHRFVEDHKQDASVHLGLHNDIHYWEGIQQGQADPTWRKIMWNPPGIYIPYSEDDYDYYTTEACGNFLAQDFAHVGRDPFNSFTFRDDSSLETSCVIQHSITSGFKWFFYDDSHQFLSQELAFREWVDDNIDFFRDRGVADKHSKKLSFGRMIMADGDDDYTKIDKKYEFILGVEVRT
jgi:hypothetical protein